MVAVLVGPVLLSLPITGRRD